MERNIAPSYHTAIVNGIRLRYVIAGKGKPLVLLHGWPQNWKEWRHVIKSMSSIFTVIAPDMRGFGDSDKPVSGYNKREVAQDIYELVHQLGFKKIYLVGHDIGMMVAYEYASSHPEDVKRLALMEAAIPGLGLETLQDSAKFPHLWHFGFFIAPGVAESLIFGREKIFLTHFIKELSYNTSAFTDDDFNEYSESMSAPGTLSSSLKHYRAFPEDAVNNRENARKKLIMPILAIGGSHGMGKRVGEMMYPLAENVQMAVIEQCGHWIPEEQPEKLTKLFLDFFS